MGSPSRPAVGAKGLISIGNEATQGVPCPPLDLDKIFDFTTESVAYTENTIETATIRETRGRSPQKRGSLSPEGDLNCELRPEGYGRMFRHALGDSIQIQAADGGARGRLQFTMETDEGHEFAHFTGDYVDNFKVDGGECVLVYREETPLRPLKVNDNATNYWEYDEFRPALFTSFRDAATLDFSGGAVTVEVNKGPSGEVFNTGAGTTTATGPIGAFYFQHEGRNYIAAYTEVDASDPNFMEIEVAGVFTPENIREYLAGNSSLDPAPVINVGAGDPAWCPASLYKEGGIFAGFDDSDLGSDLEDTLPSGTWVYSIWEDQDNRENLYTQHLEIASELPPGLTVEIVRDAVTFTYSGVMVNTMTINAESQGLVTGTFSLLGIAEYSVVHAAREIRPGASSIFVREEPVCFNPSGGIMTIGKETNILYDGYSYNSSLELWEIDISETTGPNSIEQTHRAGTNVESRVTRSTVSPRPSPSNAPVFAAFEANIAKETEIREVLSASLTLENNLGADKFMLGERTRAAIREERALVSGVLNVEFDNGDHYKDFLSGRKFSVDMRLVSDELDYIAIDGVFYPIGTYFFCPRVKLNGDTPNIDSESYIVHDLNFDAEDDEGFRMRTPALVMAITNRLENDAV